MPRTIQVFEHESLTLHENKWGNKLERNELAKLYAFNDAHDNQYFTGIRDGVKFKSFVGVIQIGGLTLEILPKADRRKDVSLPEHNTSIKNWHNALLQMLAICRHIDLESVSEANLKKRSYSLLDLYFDILLKEVELLLHLGLIKKYHRTESNLPVLKGRLNFNKNIQQNIAHQERFYTDHQIYDQNHLINQILLRALVILKEITPSSLIRDKLNRIHLDFPEVKHLNIQAKHFDQLVDSRKTSVYEKAIKIAKMIILNYSPDIKSGNENMLALLFDMNKLWEEYIYRMLSREQAQGIEITFQNAMDFWGGKRIRPDLVIKKDSTKEQKTFIIDTKWKIIDSAKPDDGDLKQIFAYNIYWKSYHGILLYPSTAYATENVSGKYHKGLDQSHFCTLAFIKILDDAGRMNMKCAEQIMTFLEEPNS